MKICITNASPNIVVSNTVVPISDIYILHLYYLIPRKFMFCGITVSQLLPIFLTQYAVSCLEGNVYIYIYIYIYIYNLYTINRLRIIFHFYHGISLTLAFSSLLPTPSPATAAAGLTGVASHVLH
jgi:hypothetical protein